MSDSPIRGGAVPWTFVEPTHLAAPKVRHTSSYTCHLSMCPSETGSRYFTNSRQLFTDEEINYIQKVEYTNESPSKTKKRLDASGQSRLDLAKNQHKLYVSMSNAQFEQMENLRIQEEEARRNAKFKYDPNEDEMVSPRSDEDDDDDFMNFNQMETAKETYRLESNRHDEENDELTHEEIKGVITNLVNKKKEKSGYSTTDKPKYLLRCIGKGPVSNVKPNFGRNRILKVMNKLSQEENSDLADLTIKDESKKVKIMGTMSASRIVSYYHEKQLLVPTFLK